MQVGDFCVWKYRCQGEEYTMGFPKGKEANMRSEMGEGGAF